MKTFRGRQTAKIIPRLSAMDPSYESMTDKRGQTAGDA